MGVSDFTIYDFICRNAQLFPDSESIVFNDIRLSHSEYKEKCDLLAAGLIKAGIGLGDRLGVLADNNDEYMILFGAAAKIGAIILPVNWRFQQEEVEYVLNDGAPKIIFAGSDSQETAAQAIRNVKSIEKCYMIGGGAKLEDFLHFKELYARIDDHDHWDFSSDVGYVIIHTAAVAGRPRGALLSQKNIIAGNLNYMFQFSLDTDGSHLCALPLFHIAGLSLSMATMHAGGKNVILSRFDPALALKSIDQEKVTHFIQFPPMLKMIVEEYQAGTYDISSLRAVGGLDHPDTIQTFIEIAPKTKFWTGFAQTEALGVTGGLMAERPGSAGKPSPMARVTLFDDFDNEVQVGSPGEICVRSETVFLGYWGLEEDTAYTFRNGWHHTGDIGRFDEDGYLWYVKRKAEKELIKPGGENVYPAEVEKVILEHEAVSEVCVIGVPDDKWGEAIKAVCVLESGKSLDPLEIIDFVASKIARYKKPKDVVFVDALPKNQDGEIDRDKVKKDHGGKY